MTKNETTMLSKQKGTIKAMSMNVNKESVHENASGLRIRHTALGKCKNKENVASVNKLSRNYKEGSLIYLACTRSNLVWQEDCRDVPVCRPQTNRGVTFDTVI